MSFWCHQIDQKPTKFVRISALAFKKKVENSDFAHFFEDGTKKKVSSEIKPPISYVAAHFMMFVGIKL